MVDHFNYDANSAAEKHDVILVSPPKALRSDVTNYFAGEGVLAVPRAVGQTLANASPLLAPVLRAPSTAYSYNPKDEAEIVEDPFATGEQLVLTSAMQARNSARFTVLGSVEMLQDRWFKADVKLNGKQSKTANREFAKKLSGWTFKELGVLKVGRLQHSLDEGETKFGINNTAIDIPEINPKIYRIKNDVVSPAALSLLCYHTTSAEFNIFSSPSQSNSPNGTRTISLPSQFPLATLFNSNSLCYLLSTV